MIDLDIVNCTERVKRASLSWALRLFIAEQIETLEVGSQIAELLELVQLTVQSPLTLPFITPLQANVYLKRFSQPKDIQRKLNKLHRAHVLQITVKI